MTSQLPETEFLITSSKSHPVIRMPERLTVLEAVRFKHAFHQLVDVLPTPRKVTLDFSRTQFLDSSGVGALVHNLKIARAKHIALILYDVHPPVMGVLSMTGLDKALIVQEPLRGSASETKTASGYQPPATHPSIRSWIKRSIDIVGSLVGLAITGILFIPLVIAIKRDSSGPIFFTQTRCGWMGKPFKIVKFRSMCSDAESLKHRITNQANGAIFKNQNDPRVTKVGRFLRRTSLDELPQFWNVLKGEMSLVGTRPPTPDEVERYDIPEWRRLNVKPGMTGEWQVHGRSKIHNFEDVIKLDLRYQENWSLQYDLRLILKTLSILFRKNSGAF